jgi:hypothetical protein
MIKKIIVGFLVFMPFVLLAGTDQIIDGIEHQKMDMSPLFL